MVDRTTISLLSSQKRVIDRMKAQYLLDTGKTLNQNEFFGLMIQYYQDHRECLEQVKIDEILEHSKQ